MAVFSDIDLTALNQDLFWAKVDQSAGATNCWPWTAYKSPGGYGRFLIGGRSRIASRIAWASANGRSPQPGMMVCHRCDNPACCNPSHLYEGTPLDNSRDAIERNRLKPIASEDTNTAVLTPEVVAEARANDVRPAEMARRYGVSRATASKALRGDTWKGVAGPRRVAKTASGHRHIYLADGKWMVRPRVGQRCPVLGRYETLAEAIERLATFNATGE